MTMSTPLIGRFLLGLTERARRSQALRIFREIQPVPFLPKSEIDAIRLARLRHLLTHASQNVPYYRELFAENRLVPEDFRSIEDLSALPVLTKDVIRSRPQDLLAKNIPVSEMVRHNSGGSTGIPLTFYHDRNSSWSSDAAVYRNFSQCGWKPGHMAAMFYVGGDKLSKMGKVEFEVRQLMRRIYQFDPSLSGEKHWSHWAKRWRTLRPKVIIGYPSSVAAFAAFLDDQGARVEPLLGAFTSGEKLHQVQRDVIGRVFQCHVYDTYGSSEVRNLAAECPNGKMHIQEDYSIIEVESAQAGAAGPLLVTSLWNYGMPFIRYRNEDFGRLDDGKCDCGRSFALMNLEVGRVSDHFTLSNGTQVHGQFFTWLLYGSKGVANFQFHQTAVDAITFYYVKSPGLEPERAAVLKKISERVEALCSPPIRLTMVEVETIPKTAAGKHRFTRSDVITNT
jgi:phenylacetate-CoA ligase